MRNVRSRSAWLAVLIAAVAAVGSASAARVQSPNGLRCSLTPEDFGIRVANLDDRYGQLSLLDLDLDRPVVFEIGRGGRHLRRVYPSHQGRTLTFDATPSSEYVVYPAQAYVDQVLRHSCGMDTERLTAKAKLKALATAADLRQHSDPGISRRAVEALQVLLGLEFRATMEYPSTEGGDYRLYAGSDFRVMSYASNKGSQRLTDLRFEMMAPDEWTVRTGADRAVSVYPGDSVSSACTVRAAERSSLRAPVSPVIAMLTFTFDRRQFRIHYPFEVRLSDPFVPALTITNAYTDRLEAQIDLRTAYAGREMKRISVYPWLNTNLTIGPRDLTVDMTSGKGSFDITYDALAGTSSYRAVTVVMKLDEHLVRLRSVMEATLDVGTSTRGAALWLNRVEEEGVTPAVIDGLRCRSVPASKRMYFAVSPNVPATGNTWISVTYHDGDGSFGLQYDGRNNPYQDCGDTVTMEGTGTWKTKTFAVSDGVFGDRQVAGSDFRLVNLEGNLAVARVAVSKFVPEDGI